MTETIPGETWKAGVGRSLVVEPTGSDDAFVTVWIADPVDGPSVRLTALQAHDIAADLLRRANLILGIPDLSGIPLVPITRPNGKTYKPQRIAIEQWSNEDHGHYDQCGVVVLGTHDVTQARAVATKSIQNWHDAAMIATKPDVDWFRLTYNGRGGEMAWQRDEVRGRAGVMFTADYPTEAT